MNPSSHLLVGKTSFLSVRFACLVLVFLQLHAPRNAAGHPDPICCDLMSRNPAGRCILNQSREICLMQTTALKSNLQ